MTSYILWPLQPEEGEWSETYTWKTDILFRRTSEQRICLMEFPVYSMEGDFSVRVDLTQAVIELMADVARMGYGVLMPVWSMNEKPTEVLSGTTVFVAADTKWYDVPANTPAMLYVSDTEYYLTEILANTRIGYKIASEELPDLTGRLTSIVPLITGYTDDGSSHGVADKHRNSVSIDFEADEFFSEGYTTVRIGVCMDWSLYVTDSSANAERDTVIGALNGLRKYLSLRPHVRMFFYLRRLRGYHEDDILNETRELSSDSDIDHFISLMQAWPTDGDQSTIYLDEASNGMNAWYSATDPAVNSWLFLTAGDGIDGSGIPGTSDSATSPFSVYDGTAIRTFVMLYAFDGLGERMMPFTNQYATLNDVPKFINSWNNFSSGPSEAGPPNYPNNYSDRPVLQQIEIATSLAVDMFVPENECPWKSFPDKFPLLEGHRILAYDRLIGDHGDKFAVTTDYVVVDSKQGMKARTRKRHVEERTLSIRLYGETKQDRYDLLLFLRLLLGRQKAFWLPLNHRAFRRPRCVDASTVVFFKDAWTVAQNLSGRKIMIGLRNGTYVYRTIEDVVSYSATEISLTLDTPLAAVYGEAQIGKVVIMDLYRLDTDKVKVQHTSLHQVEIALKCRKV